MRSQLNLQKYKDNKVITLWGKALSCGFPSQKSHDSRKAEKDLFVVAVHILTLEIKKKKTTLFY